MAKRNFAAEFARITAVDYAARDSRLRYFLWDVIHSNLEPLPGELDEIKEEVYEIYNLDPHQLNLSVATCIAGIIDGVETGREIFSND